MPTKTKKYPKTLKGSYGAVIEKGKLYEFKDIPLGISRAIVDLYRREGRDVIDLLTALWMWEGDERWKMMKPDQK